MSRRLLVTGSRSWNDWDAIRSVLAARYSPDTVLVTGACPQGADAIAEAVWRRFGGDVERHPAQWSKHGRAAGPRRNKAMVELGADECLAFIRDDSAGATGCAAMAESAGIPTRRIPYRPQAHPSGSMRVCGD
jgi:hypothetical protein